jgi:hypothetical protein
VNLVFYNLFEIKIQCKVFGKTARADGRRGGAREKAVKKLKALLSEGAVYEHMAQKHLGEAVPTIDRVHAVIEQNLKPAS